MTLLIRPAAGSDVELVATIISRSFADVAERFGLTSENCPKHPSNCAVEWIEEDLKRGTTYFVAEQNGAPVGCVGMERASDNTCYLERLAVLPDRRRHGIGRALVDRVVESARTAGVERMSVGIIADHVEVRDWYRRLGFREGATKRFAHLPFEVLLMDLEIDP